jgi:tRNA threonylcarbamoyladenosine biosynthesis protein TsaB
MALILNIETSTTVCSVCISDEEKILSFKTLDNGYTHAENLHVFIRDVIQESKKKISDLSAVAVSKGPGSYTGLRIGVSAAKGIAYALDIPLISVDTLQIMTMAATKVKKDEGVYYPMIDARRMEVYTAAYDPEAILLKETNAVILDEGCLDYFSSELPKFFFGNGMQKAVTLLSALQKAYFIENIHPSAVNMPLFSFRKFLKEKFEDTAYFEPFYLKDFYIHPKKN